MLPAGRPNASLYLEDTITKYKEAFSYEEESK